MKGLFTYLRRFWNDINGLVTLADMLGVAGFWLYRGTARRTTTVAVALLGLVLIGKKTGGGVSLNWALTGTGGFLLLSFFGGLALMWIGGSVSKHVMTIAEAKGSNLLEDMKKDRANVHAQAFWECVFQYEVAYEDDQTIAREAIYVESYRELLKHHHGMASADTDSPRYRKLTELLSKIGLTRDGFVIVYDYAVYAPIARSLLRNRLRYDLAKVKDWYDGAPFHTTDTKLQEQFHGSDRLRKAQSEARLGLRFWMEISAKRSVQDIWFRFIVRAIQMRIAQACRKLDHRYPQFEFCPDHFLWPTEESYELIRQELGDAALKHLVTMRQRIFQRVFNTETVLAYRLMQKAIYPNFDAATLLRRRYDPEYAIGTLDQSWRADLLEHRPALAEARRAMRRHKRIVERAEEDQANLKAFLDQHDVLSKATSELCEARLRRVLGVVVHVNRKGVAEAIRQSLAGGAGTQKALKIIREAIDEAPRLERRLIAVRIHHTLTRLELKDYEFYLQRILLE